MPAGGTRSMNGSCGLGRWLWTASITSCVACGPVTASTEGWISLTMLSVVSPARAPRQPVTMTLPLAARASPIVSRLSFTASSMNPQVLTITRSAPSKVLDVAYPSALSCVRISSESVRAFGQPRLTKPTLGMEEATGVSGTAISLIPLLSPEPKDLFLDAECAEHLLGVLLHLLLHLLEHGSRLLRVSAHALRQRVLHVHELRPHLGREVLGLLRHLALDVGEGLHVLLEVAAHEALHRVAVEADDVRERRLREHRRAAGLFFQDDLQQDAAREVLVGLGVAHHEGFAGHHQLLHFGQGDVRGRVRVVEPPVRVLLDDALCRLGLAIGFLSHETGLLWARVRAPLLRRSRF